MAFVAVAAVPTTNNLCIAGDRPLVRAETQNVGTHFRCEMTRNVSNQLAVDEDANSIGVVRISLDQK